MLVGRDAPSVPADAGVPLDPAHLTEGGRCENQTSREGASSHRKYGRSARAIEIGKTPSHGEEYCRRQWDKDEVNRILSMEEQAALSDTPPGSCRERRETERDKQQTDR